MDKQNQRISYPSREVVEKEMTSVLTPVVSRLPAVAESSLFTCCPVAEHQATQTKAEGITDSAAARSSHTELMEGGEHEL